MTHRIYYEDAYIKEFFATVISSDKCGELYVSVLDKTAFFPEEGGQYSDKGYIDGIRVMDVQERDGVILHYTEAALSVGKDVFCRIDFDERFEKMQCHTGEHILSGLFNSIYGLDNVGFHLGADEVTMDLSAALSRTELDEVERLANEVIYKNVEVSAELPSAERLQSIKYRSKLDLTENVRIVHIGEYDSCACCAPHVKYTGEIGVIKILDASKLRGGMRLHITAGRRAARYFSELYRGVQSVSEALSLPKADIASGVERLLRELSEIKAEFSRYRIKSVENVADKVETTSGNAVVVLDGASTEELIAFSNRASSKVGGILVLLSGSDGAYRYVISSSSVDLRTIAKNINKSLLGRGGGKSNMLQGFFSCGIDEIRRYFA